MKEKVYNKIDLSIIIPAYNEEKSVKQLYLEIKKVLSGLDKSHEIIFIDDGSTDNTFNVLKKLSVEDRRLKIIRFRRNFGKSAALAAGFKHTRGNFVVSMDSDLQDDPEEIPNFLEKTKEGYDLIVGWKVDRKDPLEKRIASKIFNKLTASLIGVNIHDSNCGFKIFRNDVVKNIELHGGFHRYIPALAHLHGYKIAEIKVKHRSRQFGKSKYGFERIIRGFLDLITVKFLMTYFTKPNYLFGKTGLLLFFLGFLLTTASFIYKFMFGVSFISTPLFSLFLIIIGIQFIFIGLLAEIIRIYYKSRGRSSYSIKDKINFEK